jgi:tetratricopeptide (TPR) repeat protein
LKLPFFKGSLIILIVSLFFSIFLLKKAFSAPASLFLADTAIIESKCKTQADFAREFELKKLEVEKESESSLKSQGYYYLAVLRFSQMQALKAEAGLDYARKYVSLSSLYYNQALDYLSQSLSLNSIQNETSIHLLKLLIYIQLHDENTAGIEFSRLSKSISDIENSAVRIKLYKDVSTILRQYNCDAYALDLYGKYFEALIASNSPEAINEVLSAADSLLEEKSYSQAFQLHRQYLNLINDAQLKQSETLLTADKYFEAKSYREAALLYENFLSISDEISDYALFGKAQSYDNLNQIDTSITAYEELIEAYPESKFYILSLEALEDNYLDTNDFDKLVLVYKKMMAFYSDDSYEREDAFYHMANVLFMNKSYQESKKVFLDFLSKYPDSSYAESSHRYLERIDKVLGNENFKNED